MLKVTIGARKATSGNLIAPEDAVCVAPLLPVDPKVGSSRPRLPVRRDCPYVGMMARRGRFVLSSPIGLLWMTPAGPRRYCMLPTHSQTVAETCRARRSGFDARRSQTVVHEAVEG